MSLRFAASLFGCCLVATTLVACGGGDSEQSSTAATGSGGGGTGGGGASGCPAGSHGTLPSCSASLEKWSPTPSLAVPRDHHVTFAASTAAGDFLFIAGGVDTFSILSSIERAQINSDGTLGSFSTDATELPIGLAGPGIAQIGNTFVLAGGLILSGSVAISGKSSYLGTIADDGGLSFEKAPDLVTDRYHDTLSTDRGFVYAIGGLRQSYPNGNPTQVISDAVERATFDGKTLGKWESLHALPHPLTHHAAIVYEHAIYLFGGIADQTQAVLTDIVRAELDEKGDVGAWTKVGSLPQGRATSSAFVFLDQVYVLCGANMVIGGEVDTVLRAPLNQDGTVGKFEELTPVPMARAHVHQTPFVNGFIYSAGGTAGGTYQNQVFAGAMK